MEWSAGDVALVIGSVATGLTAVGGVILPLYHRWDDRRSSEKDKIYDLFFKEILTCIEVAEDALSEAEARNMFLAMHSAGSGAPFTGNEANLRALSVGVRKVDLYAKRFGVDAGTFVMAGIRLPTLASEYDCVAGKLSRRGDPEANLQNSRDKVLTINEMVDAGTKLLLEVKRLDL